MVWNYDKEMGYFMRSTDFFILGTGHIWDLCLWDFMLNLFINSKGVIYALHAFHSQLTQLHDPTNSQTCFLSVAISEGSFIFATLPLEVA